jgi:ParB-like chromosome segregation protein Spo0J
MFIETAEQYLAYRQQAQPVILTGKRRQQIPVPCANTILVKRDLVVANTYNPNHVSDDKMELLRQSIIGNGFAFPVVVIWDDDQQLFVVVDGFHRYTISGPRWLDLSHVPVAVLEHDAAQRMLATWQFNKARGSHEVDLDADLIRALIEQGMAEDEIATHLGIDLDTVHRYKQITGIAELFKNADYSMSWEVMEVSDNGKA